MWILAPIFQKKDHRVLPFRVWLPSEYVPDNIFWIIYVPVSLSIVHLSLSNIAQDEIFDGMTIVVCGQFDILKERLLRFQKTVNEMKLKSTSLKEIEKYEQKTMKKHIRHHLMIYELVLTDF